MHCSNSMNRLSLSFAVMSALLLGNGKIALAQARQPKMLIIDREEVKPGRNAEHARNEAGWPAAYEKAGSLHYEFAVTSITGPNEVWYISTWDSHAALASSMKRDEKDPVLSAELARLALADAEYINGSRALEAMDRADLSIGEFPDLGKMRFFEVTTFRIRAGHEKQFEDAAQAYGAAAKRAAPKSSFRIYQVIAGMPGANYLVFSSVEDYAQFDQTLADDQATRKAATDDEMGLLTKCATEAIIDTEKNRFRLDPTQSYVPKSTREKDPDFWSPKK